VSLTLTLTLTLALALNPNPNPNPNPNGGGMRRYLYFDPGVRLIRDTPTHTVNPSSKKSAD
jgi:hypothetical protein